METVDGNKGSAIRAIYGKSYDGKNAIIENTIVKYKVMKWRMKISIMAFEKNKTVKELFLETIMKSYMSLFDQGKIPIRVEELFRQQDIVFDNILKMKF
jgi:hypothetical protein